MTAEPFGPGRVLAALRHWARTRGADTALRCGEVTVTWSQLLDDVVAVSARLRGRRIGRGSMVALATGRTPSALTALLATWHCGATVVLVDERQPVAALGRVCRDAGIELVLTHAVAPELVPLRLPALPLATLPLATLPRSDDAEPDLEPLASDPDDLAYLVYTSGTTGVPKGVEVTARNLDHFLQALATIGLEPGGLSINAVSPAFDGWLWCTLLALTSGQGMALVDPVAADGTGVGDAVAAVQPRTVSLTPSLLNACDGLLPSAEVIVVAGEACPPALVQRFGQGRRMLNVYGPTEATIAATWADSAAGDDATQIGRPLPGYTVTVLDADRRPVPRGEVGEVAIGGPAVARGYRGQPELTAERFVATATGRVYLTGDAASERPDGTLAYAGRRDDQVKVRGVRVELAGIDRMAEGLPGIGQAAAYLLDGGEALGLAVTAGVGQPLPGSEELRTQLGTLLPAAMVPTVVQPLRRLPTTGTGKIDRAALSGLAAPSGLPAPTPVRPEPGPTARPAETLVAEVWAEVLGAPLTDLDADFFDLGGHSLLAARVVATLRRRTGADITLRLLLSHPTVRALADSIDDLAVTS